MPFKLGGEVPMGHVKLPHPITSDYLIPNKAVASSKFSKKLIPVDALSNATGESSYTTSLKVSWTSFSKTLFIGDCRPSATIPNGGYIQGNIVVDTTPWDKFKFCYGADLKNSSRMSITKGVTFQVLIDGVEVYSGRGTNILTPVRLDLSSYTGTHTISFRLTNNTGADVTAPPDGYPWCVADMVIKSPRLVTENSPSFAIDNDTSTTWKPSKASPGEWIYIDLGVPTIVGGARIYWGANVPNAYRIQASVDATDWWDVYQATAPPAANDWTEYSWYATYARYLRVYIDDPGSDLPEIGEFHYYSRITDRVAAEHGHGSGVEKWKKGSGAKRGFKKKKALKKKLSKKKKKTKLDEKDIVELIEEILDYIDFKVPD